MRTVSPGWMNDAIKRKNPFIQHLQRYMGKDFRLNTVFLSAQSALANRHFACHAVVPISEVVHSSCLIDCSRKGPFVQNVMDGLHRGRAIWNMTDVHAWFASVCPEALLPVQ